MNENGSVEEAEIDYDKCIDARDRIIQLAIRYANEQGRRQLTTYDLLRGALQVAFEQTTRLSALEGKTRQAREY